MVLMLAVVAAGCGSDESVSNDRSATQATSKQTLKRLLDGCLKNVRQFPDAQSRKQGEAACRASAADVPTGPNMPSDEDIERSLNETCAQRAAHETDPAIRRKLEKSCSDKPAKSAPASTSTKEPAVKASKRAIPAGGPKAISTFPVPAGAKYVDLGPAYAGNWQFGISSPDKATTLEFYRKTLAAMGYKLKEDVTAKVGANTIQYDLTFSGPTYGVVDSYGDATQVTVDDRPISALEP